MKNLARLRRPWRRTARLAVLTAVVASGLTITGVPAAVAAPACSSTRGTFVPTRAYVTGIGYLPVVSVGRTSSGSMASPPSNTDAGLHEFGWYRYAAYPGSGSGGVAIDAHTWYGHNALGDQLLSRLKVGGIVILYNASLSRHVCYRVSSRTQYALSAVPMSALVRGHAGGQQLGIMVCSGTRTVRNGVAYYDRRTVWFAQAVRPS